MLIGHPYIGQNTALREGAIETYTYVFSRDAIGPFFTSAIFPGAITQVGDYVVVVEPGVKIGCSYAAGTLGSLMLWPYIFATGSTCRLILGHHSWIIGAGGGGGWGNSSWSSGYFSTRRWYGAGGGGGQGYVGGPGGYGGNNGEDGSWTRPGEGATKGSKYGGQARDGVDGGPAIRLWGDITIEVAAGATAYIAGGGGGGSGQNYRFSPGGGRGGTLGESGVQRHANDTSPGAGGYAISMFSPGYTVTQEGGGNLVFLGLVGVPP